MAIFRGCFLQWTLRILLSSRTTSGISLFFARQVTSFPWSSVAGMKDTVEKVTFPSEDDDSRTLGIFFPPFHQEICAGGRDPTAWHCNSARRPEDSGRVPLVMDTSSGLTVEMRNTVKPRHNYSLHLRFKSNWTLVSTGGVKCELLARQLSVARRCSRPRFDIDSSLRTIDCGVWSPWEKLESISAPSRSQITDGSGFPVGKK